MKPSVFSFSLFLVCVFYAILMVFWPPDRPDTVMGISHSLACPCECPMVLEDCHMSCGLEWKDNIGGKLKSGLTKSEIEGYFFKKYGREAMLTPFERISGKWYQITRGGYPAKDFILFGAILLVWSGVVYYLIMGFLEFFRKKFFAS